MVASLFCDCDDNRVNDVEPPLCWEEGGGELEWEG